MLSSLEPRRRKKDSERDRESTKNKDKDKDRERESKERHRSHRSKSHRSSEASRKSSSTTSKDRDRDREREPARAKTPSSRSSKSTRNMAVVPELERRTSLGSGNGSRTSLPYPTFSKAHSKESVGPEDAVERKKSPFTPEPTDLSQGGKGRKSEDSTRGQSPSRGAAPPSPPLTASAMGADLRKTASANSMKRRVGETVRKEMEDGRRSVDSGSRLTREHKFMASRSSVREGQDDIVDDLTDLTSTTERSQPSTIRQEKTAHLAPPKARNASPSNARPPGTRSASTSSRQRSDLTQTTDSDATSVPPGHQAPHRPPSSLSNTESSPLSVIDSSPRTPTQSDVQFPPVVPDYKERPVVEVITDVPARPFSVDQTYTDSPMTPPPPPPPPPMMQAPRVDYLLQHGGLPHPVPRGLLDALSAGQPHMARPPNAPDPGVARLFAPLQHLLDNYLQVVSKDGSLAAATGYRPVARRLLDRLESVFARNISSEYCQCIMCLPVNQHINPEEDTGVNWGEVLEYVSDRRELPAWPPFQLNPGNGLGISDIEAPMQKLDIDVPEEFRDHYIRQSKKVKSAVQSWLGRQEEEPPEEVDDDTLSFAIITYLDPQKRPLFNAIMRGMSTLPGSRAPTPMQRATPATLTKAGLGLQRLYRLKAPPRDPLITIYMIKNPELHNVLATLAAVTKNEWEILVSGRFDGFLWSGAEDLADIMGSPGGSISRGPSRGPTATPASRTTTPFVDVGGSMSRGPTPFSPSGRNTRPGPVALDEDTEIATLAEIEQQIYHGMEALEDAFEALHTKAESVRQALRLRSAGLAQAAQARRGSNASGIEVRTDTPASFADDMSFFDDGMSEIIPDDSASNISYNRRRKKGRKMERRTPAPVEEESDTDIQSFVEDRPTPPRYPSRTTRR